MTVQLAAVTIDCDDALTVGRFWAAALIVRSTPGVPGVRVDRHARAPGHDGLDAVASGRADVAVRQGARAEDGEEPDARRRNGARPRGRGEPARRARRDTVGDVDEWGYRWTVLQDPEGNEFCVAELV